MGCKGLALVMHTGEWPGGGWNGGQGLWVQYLGEKNQDFSPKSFGEPLNGFYAGQERDACEK